MRQIRALFVSIFLLLTTFCYAALLFNIPQEIKQPDGTVIHCLASGDEFNNRLHDADDYTIVQNHENGKYVYAIPEGNGLKASNYVVGKVDPKSLGLTKGLQEDPSTIQARADAVQRERAAVVRDRSALGQINNVVIFVRFSDQTEFPTSKTYNSYSIDFNQTTTGATSLKAYFLAESNSQLTIDSYLYPPANGTYVVSYQDSHTRNYYCLYDATTNPTGYTSDGGTRERALLGAAITYVDNNNYVPDGLNIDQNGDGNMESVTFIIQGNTTGWNQILWPHNSVFGSSSYYINGKKATSYNVELSNAFSTGVVSHEMSHTFGFTDLYHYSTLTDVSPAGSWDIMCNNGSIPQAHLVSEKYKHGGWCPEPTLISTPGVYTLSPISTSPYAAYKIASNTTGQHYIVEYRKKEGPFESSVPGSGLIIYRINTARNGNATPPDEVWIYRPGSNNNSTNGTVGNAFYSLQSGRTSIHQYTIPSSYLESGSDGGLIITDITEAGSTISFELRSTIPKIWSGAMNGGWGSSYNWRNGVPGATDDVIIPGGCNYYPILSTGNTCNDLTVEYGAHISFGESVTIHGNMYMDGQMVVNSSDSVLTVNGNLTFGSTAYITTSNIQPTRITCAGRMIFEEGSDLDVSDDLILDGYPEIAGDITMSNTNVELTVTGDLIFNDGSSLLIGAPTNKLICKKSMDINVGAAINLNDGTIEFSGTNNSNIRVYTPTSFYNLDVKKTYPGALYISAMSTSDLTIKGSLTNYAGSSFNHYSSHMLIFNRHFTNSPGATYTLTSGTVKFAGSSIQYLYDYGTGCYFNNLTVATTGTANLYLQHNIQVKGNFTVDTGDISTLNNSIIISIGGNWTNNTASSIFGSGSGRVVLNGTGDQVCTAVSGEIFDYLELNKPSGAMVIPSGQYINCYHLDWTSGSYRVDGGHFTALDLVDSGIFGNITLNSGQIDLSQESSSRIDFRASVTIHDGIFNVHGGLSPCYFSLFENSALTMDGGTLDFQDVGVILATTYYFNDNITGGTISTTHEFDNERTDFNPTGGTIKLYGTADAIIKNTAGSNFPTLMIYKGARDAQTGDGDIPLGSGKELITRSNTVTGQGPIDVNGPFCLYGGSFVAPSSMQVAGAWINLVGPAAFVEGTGTVEMNGNTDQYCNYSETFYTLYINKSGGLFKINSSSATITCSYYTFGAGGIEATLGTFTANDLTQNGIYGNFTTYQGGTINLTQDASQWIDIDGYLYNLGGNINIYGGALPSDWAYAANGGITMNGGTIDFKNKGVRMPATAYTLTVNVIGGTIRACGGYEDSRTNVTMAGGTVELYGAGTASLLLATGSSLYDLIVNKATTREGGSAEGEKGRREQGIQKIESFGKTYEYDYRTDGITVNSNVFVAGSLSVNAGLFDLNGYTVETAGDISVSGSVKMASSACNLLCGGNMSWNSGSTTTVSAGTIQCWGNWTFSSGSAAQLTGTTVQLRGTGSHTLSASSTNSWFYTLAVLPGTGGVYNYAASSSVVVFNSLTISSGTLNMLNSSSLSVANDLTISSGAGLNAGAGSNASIVLGRNWTDSNANYNEAVGFNPGTSTITLTGSQVQTITPSATNFTVYNLVINKTAASNEVHFTKPVTVNGDCLLQQGLWIDSTNGFTHNFYGGFGVFTTGTFAGGTYVSTINFTGSNPGALIFSGSGYVFNLTVNKSSVSSIVTLYSNVYALGGGSINVNVGTLDLSHYLLRTTGNVTVGNGGKISLGTDATIEVADGKTLAVNSGGIFESLGSLEHLAKVTRQSGLFFFNINSGGTISAEWTLFEYMSTGGVYVKPGALVSTIHSFHHCTFQNGGASLALLVINNDQTITINDPIFPANTWSGTWNVRKTVNSGTVNIYNATGSFAGATYEGDNYARINWYSSIPDLVMTGYSITSRTPVVGTTITYQVYVTNNTSSAISTSFRVGMYKNAASQPAVGTTPDSYYTISSLAAGATATCTFNVSNTTVTTWNTYFLADYQGVLTESDENNNGFGPLTVNWQTLPVVSPPTITRVSNTVIRLDWTYAYTVTRYKIYRSTNPYSGFTQIGTTTNKYFQETASGKYFYYITAEL